MVNKNNDNDNTTSSSDFSEDHVNRMITGIQTSLSPQYGNTTPEDEAAAVIAISSATKKYCELKIKMLQDSPRNAEKLREILQAIEEQYQKAEDSENIERLVIEIDMLKYLLFLVHRANERKET